MQSSEPKVDPKTVQRLVLARLLVSQKRAPSQRAVVRSVAAAICPPLEKSSAEDAARRALSACERAGWIANAEGRRLVLSAAGKGAAPALLGRASLPRIASWQHAQQLVALGSIGRAKCADEQLSVDALAALILGEREDAPATLRSLQAVVDYLAWRALGVETTRRFDAQAVQRHLLSQLVPADVRVDKTVWRRMLAMRAANARGHDARALVQALLCEPPKPKRSRQSKAIPAAPPKSTHTPANHNDPRPRAQPTLADFAAAVREAAHLPTVAKFHDRAYIGSVWDHMRGHDLTLPEFKQRLIAAHRDGLLRITRADLVGAMDQSEVERSEARYQDATFHFVALEAGGVS